MNVSFDRSKSYGRALNLLLWVPLLFIDSLDTDNSIHNLENSVLICYGVAVSLYLPFVLYFINVLTSLSWAILLGFALYCGIGMLFHYVRKAQYGEGIL